MIHHSNVLNVNASLRATGSPTGIMNASNAPQAPTRRRALSVQQGSSRPPIDFVPRRSLIAPVRIFIHTK